MTILLTSEHVMNARSVRGGYKAAQLKLLDIEWPPRKSWKHTVIGKSFDADVIRQFVEFNDNAGVDAKKENKPKTKMNLAREGHKSPETVETQALRPVASAITTDNNFPADIYVYTDGACSNNGKPDAKGGVGVFFSDSDPRNLSVPLDPDEKQTNNVAELSAIIAAYYILEADIDANKTILICSDSSIAIGWTTTTGEKYAKTNWQKKKGVIPNVELNKKAYELFRDKENIKFLKVAAHTTAMDKHSVGNRGADLLANQAIGLDNCPYSEENPKDERIYLNVAYKDKDHAKSLGARWDPKEKKWYTSTNNEELFRLYSNNK